MLLFFAEFINQPSIDNQWIEKSNAEASEYEKTEI